MNLEKRLTKELFEEVIGKKKSLLENIGVLEEEHEPHLLETRREYDVYNEVNLPVEKRASLSEIARRNGYRKHTLSNWAKGKVLPRLFTNVSLFSRKPIDFVNTDKALLASFLGYFTAGIYTFGSQLASQQPMQMNFYNEEKSVLDYAVPIIFSLFHAIPEITERSDSGWATSFSSEEFFHFFKQETDNHSMVPWKFLDTEEKKAAYLRSFALRKSGIQYDDRRKSARIVFSFKKNFDYQRDFALLLFELGFLPSQNKTKVELSSYQDLKSFHDNFCVSERKKETLGDILDKLDLEEETVSPKEFWDLRNAVKSGHTSRKEAHEQLRGTNYTPKQMDCALYTTKRPNKVKRYLQILDLYEQRGKFDRWVFYYTSHHLGYGASFSKYLSHIFDRTTLIDVVKGDSVYSERNKDSFSAAVDLIFWKNLFYSGDEQDYELVTKNGPSLTDVMDTYVSEGFLSNSEISQTIHLQLFCRLRSNPRFSSLIYIENGDLYVNRSSLGLVETLFSSAGFGGKKRKLKEN